VPGLLQNSAILQYSVFNIQSSIFNAEGGAGLKIVIIGAGQVGFHIAGHLAREKKDVVVVDKDPEATRRVSETIDVQVVTGAGSSPVTLEKAGIKEAEIVLAVTDSDETNLVACLLADHISSSTIKVARVRGSDFDDYLDRFRENSPHIDTLINPEIEVVKTIDGLMKAPGALEVGELVNGRIKIVGIRIDGASDVTGIPLSRISEQTGKQAPLIAAIVRGDNLIVPRGDQKMKAGDLVYFMSEADNLNDTLSVFNKHADPVRHVLIVGGGRIGYRLAALLEVQSVNTKIIEKDPDRCVALAQWLDRVTVLHGDGSDQQLLTEENIKDMDVVVTLTDDDENNILTSLLARQMGVAKTITRIGKFSYFHLMPKIGLEQVVSPRLSAINTILQYIRRGKVVSAIALKGEQAEVMEAVALETSDIVGHPLEKINFPKGVLVTGIIRKDAVIIPNGKSVVEPDDRLIIFAAREAIPKIEKILSVKLDYF
jgi:trk system potassium uptake protein TrkA